MITLSLCMIVKNEEAVLERCLSCVADIVDELIIVDTGSSDSTREIAHRFTPHVYDFTWCDDFAAARNFSFSKATQDYTMWLDADDVLAESERQKLLQLKTDLSPTTDMVLMHYDVAFDADDRPTLSYYRERIFRTALQYRWIGAIHEVIPQYGVAEHRPIHIQHRKMRPNEPQRNLKIFERMVAEGKELDPRQQYYFGRELMYNQRHAEAIVQFRRFLQEGQGWVENNISACKDLATCLYAQKDPKGALQSLLQSLTYDVPRAELCCEIGKHFYDLACYATAIFWYELAASRPIDQTNGGFCLPDCYSYIPYMQLCVCFDRLGQRDKAVFYNEQAGACKPQDPSYLYNKSYFEATAPQ